MSLTQEPSAAGQQKLSSRARPRMTAFFFQDAAKPLFGLYGPPCGAIDREEAILLCAPPGHEYQRTHWCLRLLGEQLILAGFHVFRFDYSGMGNSWGTFDQSNLGQWVSDVQAALRELADNSGIHKLSVVGLRLGATMAWLAPLEMPLEQLVLWDPVPEGRAYVDNMRRMQTELKKTWLAAPPCTPGAAFEDLLGYRHGSALIEQLDNLNLNTAALPRAKSIRLVLSANYPYGLPFQAKLESHCSFKELRLLPETTDWNEIEAYAEPMLLVEARKSIVALLGGSIP